VIYCARPMSLRNRARRNQAFRHVVGAPRREANSSSSPWDGLGDVEQRHATSRDADASESIANVLLDSPRGQHRLLAPAVSPVESQDRMQPFSDRFVLRAATDADIPGLLEMIRGLAEYEGLSHIVECTPERLRSALFGERPSVEALIARPVNRGCAAAAGFALYFQNFSTFLGRRGLYLEDLYVRPEFRGQGCATAMLSKLARIAHDRGCGRFEWSVLDWNAPAKRLYERLGAEILPDWRIVRLTGEALERAARREGGG
jgi:GNAT superfamily N-acetyltransferase